MAAPRLLAGLMPVPVMGMVAKCTKNTANPIGSGAKICIQVINGAKLSLLFSLRGILEVYIMLKYIYADSSSW